MEPSAVTTEQDERELRRIGRRVASSLDASSGRAIPAARRRLFDGERQPAGLGARWVVGLAAVGAVAAIALALRDDPSAPAGGDPDRAARSQASRGEGGELPGLAASEGSRFRIEPRTEGATELVLESGDASGVMGPRAQGPRAVVAGPYRVTGDAELTVRWSDVDGLTVEVKSGEARILAPGITPAVVPAGATKKLPARP